MAALDLHDVNLMGISYGGWIAANMALARPERLRRTVLLAPAGVVLRLRWWWVLRLLLAALHPALLRRFWYWFFADAVTTSAGRQVISEATADIAVGLRCFVRRRTVMVRAMGDEELRAIRIPSLFLVGENERIYSAQKAVARLQSIAPQIEAQVIPHAGHDLVIAQAAATTEKVLAFLGR